METILNIVIVLIILGFMYVLFKPKATPKSKEQKQEELITAYKQKLDQELSPITDANEKKKRKVALLKTFAKELEFNLFFDEHEVKALIQELAKH